MTGWKEEQEWEAEGVWEWEWEQELVCVNSRVILSPSPPSEASNYFVLVLPFNLRVSGLDRRPGQVSPCPGPASSLPWPPRPQPALPRVSEPTAINPFQRIQAAQGLHTEKAAGLAT